MAVQQVRRAQWLTVQYDNRARIAAHPQIFARWAQDSAAVRAQVPALLDVTYGEGPGECLDVFGCDAVHAGAVPDGAGKPVLVFIHGGWWRSLDKADHSFVAPAFVDAGALVVVPNYGLCPVVTVGDIACQMARAVACVVRHAAAWGGDGRRVTLVGHSAGGHLAAMLLRCDWARVAPDLAEQLVGGVRRAVSISGVFDLEAIRATPFLQADLQLSRADALALSPARFSPPGAGHLAAFVGADESEEFHRQNRLIRRRWGSAAVPVCEAVAGHNHLTILDDLARPQGRIHAQVRRWLAASA